MDVGLLADPDIVATPRYAALTAGWFWSIHDLKPLADARDDLAITKKINGGTNGLDDRIARTQKALDSPEGRIFASRARRGAAAVKVPGDA